MKSVNKRRLNLIIMKRLTYALAGLLLLFGSNLYSEETGKNSNSSQETSMNVLCSPDLQTLANGWASQFSGLNPDLKINIVPQEMINSANLSPSTYRLAFISESGAQAPVDKQLWKMPVARDIVVPVINAKNPFMDELLKKGITAETFLQMVSDPGKRTWGTVIAGGSVNPVHIYIGNDEIVISALKKFLAVNRVPGEIISSKSPREIVGAIQDDPYGIGFCKLTDVAGPGMQSLVPDIHFMPIDKNKNGRIDYMEEIYDRPENLARGVWIGKYPRSLYSEIYCVSYALPSDAATASFLKWILTEGQKSLYRSGYSDLVYGERQARLDKINVIRYVPPANETNEFPMALVLSLSALVVLAIIFSIVAYSRKARRHSHHARMETVPMHFSKSSVDLPKGLYYDRTHTWAFMEKDGMVKIGIDDFLQHVTGPITRIEMRKAGEKVRKGDRLITIMQNGKHLVVYAPVSGTIRQNNDILVSKSGMLNSAPYTEGWVYRIEPSNWIRETQLMEMAEKYQEWLVNEFSRLKEFFSGSLKVYKLEYDLIVLQDGGELKDGILTDFGPEVWEDFQANFLDSF
jgi:glycine cleavage system H lipoate-binding protein/ABC-type phosphate transport system substrate-binding protein